MIKMKKQTDGCYYGLDMLVFHLVVLVIIATDKDKTFKVMERAYRDIGLDNDYAGDKKTLEEMMEDDGDYLSSQTVMLNDKPSRDIIVIFNADSPADISEEDMVHEFHHAAKFVCDRCGIDDEETEAYTQEYLYHQMLCRIYNYNNSQEKKKRKSSNKDK